MVANLSVPLLTCKSEWLVVDWVVAPSIILIGTWIDLICSFSFLPSDAEVKMRMDSLDPVPQGVFKLATMILIFSDAQ